MPCAGEDCDGWKVCWPLGFLFVRIEGAAMALCLPFNLSAMGFVLKLHCSVPLKPKKQLNFT